MPKGQIMVSSIMFSVPLIRPYYLGLCHYSHMFTLRKYKSTIIIKNFGIQWAKLDKILGGLLKVFLIFL